MQFTINNVSYLDILSDLNIEVTHTYTGEIKRTLKGKVTNFPVSFRTVGLNVILIGKVSRLTSVLNAVQVAKVTLDFTDTVYQCTNGKYSCTEAKLERIKDRQEKQGRLTMAFVSVGIPTLVPDEANDIVTITAPDNT